jgi:tetratricopeptide (TPR) repeat protein
MRFPSGWCLLRLGSLALLGHSLLAQDEPVAKAMSAIESGDLPSAEQILRTELRAHPNDRAALEVMAVVLDQQKKYTESDGIYRRVLALASPSPSLLNNFGNHLLSMGKTKEAQAAFTKVLAIEPHHPNATVQMARLALDRQSPAEARGYLERLPAEILDRPDVVLLRIRTEYGLHRNAEADALLERAAAAANGDAQQCLALGEAVSAADKNDKAEALFARSMELQPASFEALYDLGLAAAHAGHNERARQVLGQALARQPENVAVMYDLAAVELKLNHGETALELLVRGRNLAPERADVQSLLARTAVQIGYFGDAVQAWEAYLTLRPGDDVAKREHAFAEMALSANVDAALADLQAYTRKYPLDPMGHYELGSAECPTAPEKALEELNRALTLKPDFAAAHLVRGLLLFRQDKAELAVVDFEKATAEDQGNPFILERLGQTYLALDRPRDALQVLRKAEQVASGNEGVLLQLGRALTRLGETEQAASVFARYREVRSTRQNDVHPAGLVDFLSLSPHEQLVRYRAGVERTVEKHPDNLEAQVRYLDLILQDGKTAEAEAVSRKIVALQPSPPVLATAAQELLEAGQYSIARTVLQQAGVTTPELQLDLAIAIDHLDGPGAALGVLDGIAENGRTGDYYLVRAQVLEGLTRSAEADQALGNAFRSNPKRGDLYRATALLLLEKDRAPQAWKVLDQALKNIPENPQLRVMKALAAALAGMPDTGEFQQIENRWPEWSQVWVAHALVLEADGQLQQAQRDLETARALGAVGAAVDNCAAEIQLGATGKAERRRRLVRDVALLSTLMKSY